MPDHGEDLMGDLFPALPRPLGCVPSSTLIPRPSLAFGTTADEGGWQRGIPITGGPLPFSSCHRPPDVGATTALWSEPELVETMHSGGAPLELRCMGAIAAPAPIESVLEPALMRCTALILILSFGIPGVPGDCAADEGSATLMR